MELTFGEPYRLYEYGEWSNTAFAPMAPGRLATGNYEADGGDRYMRYGVIEFDENGDAVETIASPSADGGAKAVVALTETKFVVFGDEYAWVCTWDGENLSNGQGSAFPLALASLSVAALTNSVVIVAGWKSADESGRAYIGIISGDSITFYNSYEFEGNKDVRSVWVCALDANRFVISYRDDDTGYVYYIAGTRNGSILSFGSRVQEFRAYSGAEAKLAKMTSNMVCAAFPGPGKHPLVRSLYVQGTSVTLGPYGAVDKPDRPTSWPVGVGALPPVTDGLWPRYVFVSYVQEFWYAPLSTYYSKVYGRLCRVASDGLYTILDDPVYMEVTETSGDHARTPKDSSILPLSQWELVLGYNYFYKPTLSNQRYVKHVDITPFAISPAFTPAETLAVGPVANGHLVRSLSDMIGVLDSADVVPNKVASETLSLSDSIAFLSVLVRILSENLALVADWELGGDWGLIKTFSERLNLSDELLNNPRKLAEEIVSINERLRLGGVFDDPRTRILTAILKAGLKTERL